MRWVWLETDDAQLASLGGTEELQRVLTAARSSSILTPLLDPMLGMRTCSCGRAAGRTAHRSRPTPWLFRSLGRLGLGCHDAVYAPRVAIANIAM